MRRLISLLMATVLCLMCASCATGNALRVESPAIETARPTPSPAPDESSQQTAAAEWDRPFDSSTVRQLLLDTDLTQLKTPAANSKEISEYLGTCAKCLIALPPHDVDGERFQIYSLSTTGDSYSFASFAIRDKGGSPEVALAVGGQDVYLSSGKKGTLVAQEAIYQAQDPMCCPSGWSVRIFRYQGGEFVEADHFKSSVDPAQTEEGLS